MILWNKPIHKDTMLDDETGKSLSAMTVFSLSIKCMVDDLTAMVNQRISGLDQKDIHWVLTVPAIWNDAAKQFMRLAAEEAGISSTLLTIALEPEAASIYCRHIPVQVGETGSISRFQPGHKYLVLDAGGGTIDITIHEVCDGVQLKELYKATGGAWGGKMVDNAFLDFIAALIGKDMLKRFKEEHMEDYIDLLRDFEVKKRATDSTSEKLLILKIPLALIELVNSKGRSFQQIVQSSQYAKQTILSGDKFRIDMNIFRSFFKQSVDEIVLHVNQLLKMDEASGVDTILMVGGYSESPMPNESIKKEFARLKVIVPPDAGLAVLKGAVICGHCPNFITQRVAKYIYGVKSKRPFVKGSDPVEKLIKTDLGDYCDDQFSIFVQTGQTLNAGEYQFEKKIGTAFIVNKSFNIDIYTTTNKDVKYVTDEGCTKIGSMIVPISGRGIDQRVIVRFKIGGTEIKVECKEETTGRITSTSVDLLT
ncbi:heat shock 70 kDa protein 12A-like isoform X2 [Dreissena polymorpha]|uniref:Uncharacterized protein n=2 Tax=Dreissena polymorpha TaxID=45954 RepID=A0A9D4HVL2_DREPO|nr:heat shock 70 kDa protein 12A-like isoform X2 [Dreissena polymorpha]KAH3736870.1 hypothetical protein DPMN_043445 [Dreissena polymorpha]